MRQWKWMMPTILLSSAWACTAPLDVDEVIRLYKEHDQSLNEGQGYSLSPDSSSLGWGESGILRAYAFCYELTSDNYWLDKIAAHFENIMATAKDDLEDGYLSWRTKRYSAVPWTAKARPGNKGDGAIEPAEGTVTNADCYKQLYGQVFTLTFLAGNKLRVTDSSKDEPLVDGSPLEPGKPIAGLPLISVKIDGTPQEGDAFEIHTVEADAFDYLVHQGLFLFPVALAMEAWSKDTDLYALKRVKFEKFESFISHNVFDRWEQEWVDVPDTDMGAYRFQDSRSQRYPATLLPHNQFLAMARTYLVLSDLPQVKRRDEYREKARRMYLYFKHFLKPVEEAYVWNYWDLHPALPNPYGAKAGPEDYSHAGLTMAAAWRPPAAGSSSTSQTCGASPPPSSTSCGTAMPRSRGSVPMSTRTKAAKWCSASGRCSRSGMPVSSR